MPYDVRPSTLDDLFSLTRFLVEGFAAPGSFAFDFEVLRWKYLISTREPKSFVVCVPGTDQIVGHVGICPGRFHGGGLPVEGVSTLHMIDWLSSPEGRGAGVTLMRRVNALTATQYSLGASDAARAVLGRAGYDLIATVPVYQRVLRPGHRWKTPGQNVLGRLLRVANDTVGRLTNPPRPPRVAVTLRPVDAFCPDIEPILNAYQGRAIFTTRDPASLNRILNYPAGRMTGWEILVDGVLRGFAVLGVVPGAGRVKQGRIVECLLDDPDAADLWHGALVALTETLNRQRVDVSTGFASTPWMVQGFEAAGYKSRYSLEFRLRDKARLVPRNVPFHLTPLEADYAYV